MKKPNNNSFYIYGINAVYETLDKSPQSIEFIYIKDGKVNSNLEDIKNIAKGKRVNVNFVDPSKIDKLSGTDKNQGVVALVKDFKYKDLKDFLSEIDIKENPCVVVLDKIEDPHNLGAIIRTCGAAGVSAVVISKNEGVQVNGTVFKTSAGAINSIDIIRVSNINSALEILKDKKFWVVGLSGEAQKDIWNYDFKSPTAIVVGSEGEGISRLISGGCDELIKIPMSEEVESLNASVSCSLAVYEWKRQNI